MKEHTPAPIGGSSLLVIFGVLCLTVLALLTLATAQAEQRLSHRSAEDCLAYYEADFRAEAVFARLRAGEMPPGVIREENRYSYAIPIRDRQELQVTLEKEESWTVLRWQSVVTAYPEAQQTLPVWNGQTQEVSP